jgi:exodeoxyribonuclease VII small subunit
MSDTTEKKTRRRKGDDTPPPLPFEQALGRLEQIVGQLETGELGLDESLALFEEGVGLSRLCQGKLAEVERKVELVLRDSKGIRTVPVAPPEDQESGEAADEDDEEDGEPF